MADISSITLPNNGGTYNFKDSVARANGKVSGVKGNSESTYRTGNVNITPANIGALAVSATMTSAEVLAAVTAGWNGTS